MVIWNWVQEYHSGFVNRFRMIRNRHAVREEIFVDETLLHIDGQDCWLWWIAYEPNLNVSFKDGASTRERTTFFVCYQQFKQLRNGFDRKPIFTDGAHWYSEACRWLRLPQSHLESYLIIYFISLLSF
jgi:transposase-like protein